MEEDVMVKEKPRSEMTRGEKAWDTRKKNEAEKSAEKEPAEFKPVTKAERNHASEKSLLNVADIMKLNMQDLINYADSLEIDTYAKSRADILVELGVTERRGGKIFVRPQPSADKLRFLNERNYAAPQNTIFPVEEFDEWLKIVEEEPMAFNGADLSDKKGEIVHTLHAHVKCVCGAEFTIPNHPELGRPFPVMMCPGMHTTILRNGKNFDVMKCFGINQFRKYMFHEVPKSESE